MALVAWYKLDGNVLDSTINGHNGTINGSPTVVNDGPIGTCYSFNPDTADWIIINNLSQFIYNTPFTISAWIKTPGLGTDQNYSGIINLTYGLSFLLNSQGYISFIISNNNSVIGATSCYDNKWHHVVCSYNGSIMKIFLDGNLENSLSNIIMTNTYSNDGVIGVGINNTSHYRFNGYISDVKIYDEALSLKEIKELSKAKILHYDFNSEPLDSTVVYDKSGYGHNGIIAEATAPTYVTESPVGKGCYQFDGTKYIEFNSPFGYTNLTQEWTVSAWINLDNINSTAYLLQGVNLGIRLIYSTTKKPLNYINNGVNDYYVYGLIDKIIVNNWLHIVYVFRNVDGYRKIYVNGEDISSSLINNNSTPYGISSILKLGYLTQGKIADFRIYATALSADDVKEIYQTRASYDKKGNIFINNVDNGDIIWDNEINSINLVTNGSAELENNTNFIDFTYINTDSYDGNGCFYKAGDCQKTIGELIKINKDDTYFLSGYFKSVGSSGLLSKLYFGIDCYDYLKRRIVTHMVYHYTNTETYLTQAISDGDTIIHVNSVANWKDSSYSLGNRLIGVYYSNEKVKFPKYTYTRLTAYYSNIDTVNNTITLSSAWSGGNVPSGTAVANHRDAVTYHYISAAGINIPAIWTKYINTGISKWDINTSNSYFRYGTEYIKLLFLLNYGQDSTYATEIDNVKFWNTKAQAKAINTQITNNGLTSCNISEVGITEGLVAYYPLNGDAKDYSGNGNHGTVYGATMTTGINGKKCYSFDGTDDYIRLSVEISTWKSISMYIDLSNMTSTGYFLGNNVDTAGIRYDGTNLLVFSGGSDYTLIPWTKQSGFVHLVIIKESTSYYSIYINGIKIGSGSTGNENNIPINYIGRRYEGYYFNGKIQDLRFYDRILYTKEINILYNMYNPNINQTIQINKENILYTKGNIKEV